MNRTIVGNALLVVWIVLLCVDLCLRMVSLGGRADHPVRLDLRATPYGNQSLFLIWCIAGQSLCQQRQAIAFGQVCDSDLAALMSHDNEGDVDGGRPGWPFRYVGFRCSETGPLHPAGERVWGGGNWGN